MQADGGGGSSTSLVCVVWRLLQRQTLKPPMLATMVFFAFFGWLLGLEMRRHYACHWTHPCHVFAVRAPVHLEMRMNGFEQCAETLKGSKPASCKNNVFFF